MQFNTDNQLIEYLLNYDLERSIPKIITNLDEIKNIIINKIEDATGCKIYNKSNIIKYIETSIKDDKSKLLSVSIEAINKNIIPEITFNSMFKSNLDFTLFFKDDEIIILYKNIQIDLNNLVDIKTDLISTKLNYLPVITELYVNNILIVIEKLINKDISVKYHLTNFPIPYWNLFEIKCKKTNSNQLNQLNQYKHLETIINGKIYQPINNCHDIQIIKQHEKLESELNINLIQIEEPEKKLLKDIDNYHRMEIMSYLTNVEVIYFLEKCGYIDNIENTLQTNINVNEYVTDYIKMLLESISNSPNKMIKYYMVNKIYRFIMKIKDFLINHPSFRKTIINKINELHDDIYIILTTKLEFSKEIINTFDNCKIFIDSIEKSQNPGYVSKWKT